MRFSWIILPHPQKQKKTKPWIQSEATLRSAEWASDTVLAPWIDGNSSLSPLSQRRMEMHFARALKRRRSSFRALKSPYSPKCRRLKAHGVVCRFERGCVDPPCDGVQSNEGQHVHLPLHVNTNAATLIRKRVERVNFASLILDLNV